MAGFDNRHRAKGFWLKEWVAKRIEAESKSRKISGSALVREILERHLRRSLNK
jgi:hypothetical protein